jgi:hypothetical protein
MSNRYRRYSKRELLGSLYVDYVMSVTDLGLTPKANRWDVLRAFLDVGVLAAYFGTFVLLEVRRYGERIAMHRVARHALWSASVAQDTGRTARSFRQI